MKKTPIEPDPIAVSAEMTISADWAKSLARFSAGLDARRVAQRTLTAYTTDIRALAAWATSAGVEPDQIGARELRRHVAVIAADG
ncbi:MAG: hypothetical protein NTX07_00375, partial [Solirubrobacterales bacterium]|nr:hypothetical protein [Solirubrobacterales bacterium]